MKLIIVDSNGKTLFECENVVEKPISTRVIKHKSTIADMIWGIFNYDKLGIL